MLDVANLTKRFGRLTAIDDISFEVARGEIVGLLGPNGAGKTTTMKILMGLVTDFTGDIILRGRRLRHRGVREALDKGIAMIHQELTYVPNLTIAQNIFLGKETTRRPFGWIDRQSMIDQTTKLL